MEERTYKVYKHTLPKIISGKENDMVYIGITCKENPLDRWGANGSHYKYNEHFSRAISKYSWQNFEHEILFDGLTKEDAEELEIALIAEYNSTNDKFGYNKAFGGSSVGKHTEKTKKMISGKAKKRFENPENNPMYGKHHSEDTKRKISEKQLEKNFPKKQRKSCR